MGNIRKLLNSIYLGDRFCENVIFRENKILFQINCISRLKEDLKNDYKDRSTFFFGGTSTNAKR